MTIRRFPVGSHTLHTHRNLDFQMNRLVTLGGGRLEDVRSVAPRIHTLADWKREFLALAERAEAQGEPLVAAAYLRAAEFFMPTRDPDKASAYDRQVALFRDAHAEDFRTGAIEESHVPYETARLPVWRLRPPSAPARSVVVAHGGYDSYAEELYPLLRRVADLGHDVVFFEGPGQGAVVRKQGLPFTAAWERPVGAVLDQLGLADVTLVGLSLGGCLAPRAAAAEQRITRVVAFDVMWDFFEVVLSSRPRQVRGALRALLALGAQGAVDRLARRMMRADVLAEWGIGHGCFVMGVDSPFHFFRRLREFTTRDVASRVSQDFLLLAGAEDHFIPLSQFHAQARALTAVRSFTGRVFTRAESAQAHCQVGNLELVLRVVTDWIDERVASRSAADGSKREGAAGP